MSARTWPTDQDRTRSAAKADVPLTTVRTIPTATSSPLSTMVTAWLMATSLRAPNPPKIAAAPKSTLWKRSC